jgi:hypothetical protein
MNEAAAEVQQEPHQPKDEENHNYRPEQACHVSSHFGNIVKQVVPYKCPAESQRAQKNYRTRRRTVQSAIV